MSDYKVKHDEDIKDAEEHQDIGEDLGMRSIWGISIAFFFFCIAISAWLVGIFGKTARVEKDIKVYHSENLNLINMLEEQRALLSDTRVTDPANEKVSIPIEDAKQRIVGELINIERNPPERTMLSTGKPADSNEADPSGDQPEADGAAEGDGTAAENPCGDGNADGESTGEEPAAEH